MIHRIPTDCIALASVATATFSSTLALTETDWQRVLGPLGGYVLSLLMLLYFIGRDKAQTRERKTTEEAAEAAREKRHVEIVDLTVKSIIAQNEMSASLSDLATEIKSRPCQVRKP